MTNIRSAIKQLARNQTLLTATVVSIDEEKRTITATIDEELEIFDIRLTSFVDENSDSFCIVYPKIGSDILIIKIEDGAWAVLKGSEIQKIHVKSKDSEIILENGKMRISAIEFEMNGGENKGLVKLEPLADVLTKITNWMRNIDAVIRNTQVVSGAVGSPDTFQIALKAAVTANNVPRVPDLENPKIKH